MRRFAIFTMILLTATATFAQQRKVKSKGEAQAVQALQKAQQAGDPDGIIKACDDLITKYADTEFKGYALATGAEAYEQKNDHDKAIVYGEQALVADPSNYTADSLLAN